MDQRITLSSFLFLNKNKKRKFIKNHINPKFAIYLSMNKDFLYLPNQYISCKYPNFGQNLKNERKKK